VSHHPVDGVVGYDDCLTPPHKVPTLPTMARHSAFSSSLK
jgi:hypothetical protein